MARNTAVQRAVENALRHVDACVAGHTPPLPSSARRSAAEQQLRHSASSVRVASLFFAFYSIVDPQWDCKTIPTGLRGEHGDKLLAAELTNRSVALHNNITAFGENLGWKGNVRSVRLSRDPRFKDLAGMLRDSNVRQRKLVADYMAARFADSRQAIKALPSVGQHVLTFARAKQLFHTLIELATEGNVQQFLIAALLHAHRRRYGIEIRTHHVHAADKFDAAAGDIEEYHDGQLLRAYEVTVRPDWKNRIPDFKGKMDAFKLGKYFIIASGVNADHELAEPAELITFLRPYGRDIAVVDILDVANVMAAELSASELREAVNKAYDWLTQPSMCGRPDIISAYGTAVGTWLDAQAEER